MAPAATALGDDQVVDIEEAAVDQVFLETVAGQRHGRVAFPHRQQGVALVAHARDAFGEITLVGQVRAQFAHDWKTGAQRLG